MKRHHNMQVKFETEQYREITRSVSTRHKNKSEVIREATRIGLPWLDDPPKNSIAKEALEGLAILHGAISLFARHVLVVQQLADKQATVPGNGSAIFAPLIARLGKVIQKAEVLVVGIEDMASKLTPLRSRSHSVLLKLKTLAEQENKRLLDDDPDRAVLNGVIKAINDMGVA